jgi:hypothetical protein
MNTSKAISVIYEIAQLQMGAEDARKTVAGVLMSVLTELEAQKAPASEDNIAKALTFLAEKFVTAAKRHAA